MAYTSVSFSSSQTLGLPEKITLTDTHVGTDALVTSRRVYITDFENNPVVPTGNVASYILWPIADTTIALDVLNFDMAVVIRVDWVNITGVALYTSETVAVFTLFSESFYYTLTQQQQGNYKIIQDKNYYYSKMILRCSIDEANNAVTYASDLHSAQSALNRANYMMSNQNEFF